MMLDGDPAKRVKADFFIELYAVRNDRFVNSFDWYTKGKFTKAMLRRYQSGKLKAVTNFRLIKQHINNARNAGKKTLIARKLKEFTESDSLSIEHLQIGTASVVAEATAIQKRVGKLVDDLRGLDVEGCIGEEKLWKTLESLLTLIRKKLRDAGRRPK